MTTTNITPDTIGAATDTIGAAKARAIDDKAFAAMFKQAGKAGGILGAGTNASAAGAFFKVVADEVAKPAAVILGLRSRDDGMSDCADLPTLEDAPRRLLELCGLVNNAIEHAQTEARLMAVRQMKAAEMSKAAKKARNAVVMRMDRALAAYFISVNFNAGTCTERDEPEADTNAEKACKRVVLAFGVDVHGALDGLAALDAQVWAYVVAHVSRLDAERTAEAADENAAALQAIADELVAKAVKTAEEPKADDVLKARAKAAADTAVEAATKARARADELAAALKAA